MLERFAGIGIEINGFQELLASELVDKAAAQGINLPIIPVEHYGVNKNTRISRLSVWLQHKFFMFKEGCRDTNIVINQLKDHPFADHDDGSDALEACLRILNEYTGLVGAKVDVEAVDDGLGDNIFL
jgi:predicted phage terminase large subunit-like protein